MNGFLVAPDGGLVAIDHILSIRAEPLTKDKWFVVFTLSGEVPFRWNLEPLTEQDAQGRLSLIRNMLQDAIKY